MAASAAAEGCQGEGGEGEIECALGDRTAHVLPAAFRTAGHFRFGNTRSQFGFLPQVQSIHRDPFECSTATSMAGGSSTVMNRSGGKIAGKRLAVLLCGYFSNAHHRPKISFARPARCARPRSGSIGPSNSGSAQTESLAHQSVMMAGVASR